uniref:Thymidine kinase n=1 Tax=Steinernema glaseri TaxID=37863 RepID=A0A1I7ZNH9_9BILA
MDPETLSPSVTNVTRMPMFHGPFTMTISGSTMSGKSVLCRKIIQHVDDLVTPKVDRIIWCYGVETAALKELAQNPRVKLIEGLPDFEELKYFDGHTLVVLDDLMHEVAASKEASALFTRYAHHYNCSVINIVQNLFFSKDRTIYVKCQLCPDSCFLDTPNISSKLMKTCVPVVIMVI